MHKFNCEFSGCNFGSANGKRWRRLSREASDFAAIDDIGRERGVEYFLILVLFRNLLLGSTDIYSIR